MSESSVERIVFKRRTAARLAAVQALYQLDLEPASSESVVQQFILHHFTDRPQDQESDSVAYVETDIPLFRQLALGTHEKLSIVDGLIESVLQTGWRIGRLETVSRAILRVAAFELSINKELASAIIINEYVQIAKFFNAKGEVSFVNACLDRLSKEARGESIASSSETINSPKE